MFRLPFGKKELEEMRDLERKVLLDAGRKELEKTLSDISGGQILIGQPIPVSPRAFGYLLYNEAEHTTINKPLQEGYLNVCKYKGLEYQVTTDRKVGD
jgi:hypothetical protein